MNLIETIGYEGPHVSFLLTSVALLNQKKYLMSFIVFYFIEYYTNGLLKGVFKQPRPSGFLDISDGGDYTVNEKYGMPSGHSTAVWYSFTYLWLVKPNHYLLLLELAVCFNTMYQRWLFKKHTVEQLVVGALVGGGIAWVGVFVTKRALK
jgi:membrane-associated phospholipid phosphatase